MVYHHPQLCHARAARHTLLIRLHLLEDLTPESVPAGGRRQRERVLPFDAFGWQMNSVAAMSCSATINASRGSPSRRHVWGSISAQDPKKEYRPLPPCDIWPEFLSGTRI